MSAVSILVRVVALALVVSPLDTAGADPNFAGVGDILGGKRHLLRVDDLVVSGAFQPLGCSGCTSQSAAYVFPSSDSTFGSATRYEVPFPGPAAGSAPLQATGIGRLFELTDDVVVTIALVNAPGVPMIHINDVQHASAFSATIPTSLTSVDGIGALVIDDVDGNGYQDIVVGYGGVARAGVASDPTNLGSGITWGPELTMPGEVRDLATGDFDGDGVADVVAAFTGLIPGGGTALILGFYTVDPQTRALEEQGLFNTGLASDYTDVALATGQFDDTASTIELAAALNFPPGGQSQALMQTFTVDSAFVATQKGSAFFGSAGSRVFANTGRFDFIEGASDQLVVGLQDQNLDGVVLFTFDANLNPIQQQVQSVTCSGCLSGVALGNFDDETDPDLEVTVLQQVIEDGAVESLVATLYDVDPSNGYAFTEGAMATVSSTDLPVFPAAASALDLVAGDTQGRSLFLGSPIRATINNHAQPDVVLGMPPMHALGVPLATKKKKKAKFQTLNVSAVPNGFFSQYQTAVTNDNQSSQSSTTSYSYGVQKTTSGSVGYGLSNTLPLTLSFSDSYQDVVASQYTNTVAQTYDTYTGQMFDASTQTGFSDQLWFTSQRFNVYTYPVIGHTGCPDGTSSCTTDQRGRAFVIFSGPDEVDQFNIAGGPVEWYQPLHEPFNVLSYPWDTSQLSATYDGFSPLTGPPVLFSTDGSVQKQSANWSQGSGSNQTAGSSSTHSFQTQHSVSATAIFPQDSFSESWTYSQSTALSTLNTAVSTVGESTGVGIFSGAPFPNPGEFSYPLGVIIFAQDDPAGVVQQIALDTDIQTTGALQTAFVADPTNPNGTGTFWAQTYQLPDVALNHPVRWSVLTQTASPVPANCLRFNPSSPTLDCVALNEPDVADIPTSEFHRMKGLLITPANGNGEGPQLVTVAADDGLFLQARVYNYTLQPAMPAGTIVHVRFYGQQVDNTGQFIAGSSSFLIEEKMLDSIPGFHSSDDPTVTNWVTASTTLDTKPYADQFLAFWVVVWLEDGQGNLVAEVPGHGLTAIPAPGTAIADMPIEPYSNNVGYFGQPVYVMPNASLPVRVAGLAGTTLERVTVKGRMRAGKKAVVSATVANGSTPAQHVRVLFYEVEPDGTTRLFDIETIPHVRAGETFVARVPYRPTTCGKKTIYAVADGEGQASGPSAVVRVKCQRGMRLEAATTRTAR